MESVLYYFRYFISGSFVKKSFKEFKQIESLKKARRSDTKGNYDIDGVSFDGDHIYVSGRINKGHDFKRP